jgi:hypothetical protein
VTNDLLMTPIQAAVLHILERAVCGPGRRYAGGDDSHAVLRTPKQSARLSTYLVSMLAEITFAALIIAGDALRELPAPEFRVSSITSASR